MLTFVPFNIFNMYYMSDHHRMVRWLQGTYIIAFPLFFFAWVVSKSFVLFGIPAYYSALVASMGATLFSMFIVRYPSFSKEVLKTCIGIALTLFILLRLLEKLPLGKNSLVSEEEWNVVLGSLHIDNIVAMCLIISPFVWSRKAYTRMGKKEKIYCNTLEMMTRSLLLYAAVGGFYLLTGNRKEAVVWFGSAFWSIVGTTIAVLVSLGIHYYIENRRDPIDQKCEEKASCILDIRLYGHLFALFIIVLLLTNVVLVRYVELWGLEVTASLLIYPFTFLLTDLISELYGCKRAEEVVISGLFATIWMGGLLYLVTHTLGDAEKDRCYSLFFSFSPGVILGSMTAYLMSQWLDVHLFAALKKATQGKHLWLRNNVGTILSQLIDTFIFGFVAWEIWPRLGSSMSVSGSEWLHVVVNEYFFKIIMALCDTPILYLLLYLIRKLTKRNA